jgi:hypothetical protein
MAFKAPLVGRLILEHTTFHVSNAPNLQLILQLPLEEETEQKLQRLLASGCPHHCHISVGKDNIVRDGL